MRRIKNKKVSVFMGRVYKGTATELDESVGRAGSSAPWGAEIGCIQPIDRRTPEQGEGKIKIVFQYFDGASHARLSGSGKPIGVSPSYHHRARPEANRLDDIRAPAYAAVHQDFDLAADGIHNLRQCVE
jgi:hypothetical protein